MNNQTIRKEKITFTAPLTHSDWFLHEEGPEWGEDGVRYMLDRCRDFGFSKILWRLYDCGRATYLSRLAEPFKWDEHEEPYQYSPGFIAPPPHHTAKRLSRIDYINFDSLEAAVRIGHELGIEVHAWMTINEDDHGFGWPSRLTRQHPEYRWIRKDGRAYRSQLSFAFPEVREYKLGLVKEALEYDVDGIFLDWIRTGDIRDNPQNDGDGIADYGYEKPNIDFFVGKYGIDPRTLPNGDYYWMAARARPITAFMREVRKALDLQNRRIPLCAMVDHPWSYRGILPDMITEKTPGWLGKIGGSRIDGAFKGLLCDIRTWASENLVDSLVVSGYYTGEGNPEKAYRYLQEETGNKVPLWLYCWMPGESSDFTRDISLAGKLGTGEILFWEADYIDMCTKSDCLAIKKAIRDYCLVR